MASCLFECLCEAELGKHYPHFVAIGLQKIEDLAKITMKDYSRLGVHNMEDRKRLFQLIQIIQSVVEEDRQEKTPLQPGCVYLQIPHNRSGTRRQLQFESSFEKDKNPFTPSELCDLTHICSVKHPGERFDTVPPADAHYSGNILTQQFDIETALKERNCKTFSVRGTEPILSDNEPPVIHRVPHVSGYNYGVPQNCLRPGASEKEGPWTETDRIRVCVRKRPLGLREERRGEVNVVTVEDKETIFIYERKEAVNLKEYVLQHVFYFDEVFSEAFSNRDVYMKTAYPLIQHVFNGGNATCFAYGQTGAGKTYTMIGTQKNPGLYALAAKDIFQRLETSQPRKDLIVWISFYEIYCGQLYDLLNGRKRLFAREDGKHIVQIVGLREVQVRSVDLLLEMISKGSRERSTGATGVNSDSSRSHAVIQIQIKDSGNRKLGRISFIDLAGSERASDARESDKQTKIEGAEINQSLLALKECIRALDQEQAHTPFRQSKLTQVLKDSFIGNSKTCMIANVSPSHIATEHTLNTLRYADRVKELKKGLKCTTPCASRSRASTCTSPKRLQNTNSLLGEKISPKKVKLGSQQNSTSNSVKSKTCPSVFHPTNIPLSSTPKTCSKANTSKANLGQAWLDHTTPVKGVLRQGSIAKKKQENMLHDPNPLLKNSFGNKTELKPEMKERGPGDHCTWNQQPPPMQKIQAVQPVQKQFVSRTGISLGAQNYKVPPDIDQDAINTQTVNSVECWKSDLPQQKEREQHLRYYHQQFQQPPILQQKLQYQPLEKFLDQYKPQEIRVDTISSPRPLSSSPSEGTHLDDLDDSDFSEDSFSYASNHKKGRKPETICERLSFFLHQGSQGPALEKSTERERGLSFKYAESQKYYKDVGQTAGLVSVFSERKEGFEVGDQSEKKTIWSSGEDSSIIGNSSKISNTPEKPFSSQEDLTSPLNKIKTSPFAHKQEKESGDSPNDVSSVEEPSDRPDSLLEFETELREKVQSLHGKHNEHHNEGMSTSSDSVSGLMPPLTVSLLKDNWSLDSAQDFIPQELSAVSMDGAKNLKSDNAWTVEAQLDPSNESPTGKNISEMVKKLLRYNEILNLHSTPQKEKDWLPQTCANTSSTTSYGSPQLFIQPGLCDKSSTREADVGLSIGLRPNSSYSISDASINFVISKSNEPQVSHYYDADTEETTVGMTRFHNVLKSDELHQRTSSESNVNAGECENKIISSTSSPSKTVNKVTIIQCKNTCSPVSDHTEHHKSSVGDVELKCFEDSFKLPFTDCDLERLKDKLIKCMFTHSSVEEEPPNCAYTAIQNRPKHTASASSQTITSDAPNHQTKALGKAQQLVVQAHREQLNEMTDLCSREEILLGQIPNSDFNEYVTKLDEILVLKSKCIHSMRSQLQLFLAYPHTEELGERTSAP
ncbi:kinesin-like protein KIF24 [Rhinophrynus dorsalis]